MLVGGHGSPKTVTNHGRNFLRAENFILSLNRYCDGRFVVLVCNSKREMFDIALYILIAKFASNQSPIRAVSEVSHERRPCTGLTLSHRSFEQGLQRIGS